MAAITVITEVSASRERGFAVGSPGAGLQCQLREDSVTFSRKQPANKQDRAHSVQEVLKSLTNSMPPGPLDARLSDVVGSLIAPIASAQAFVRASLLPRGTGAFR